MNIWNIINVPAGFIIRFCNNLVNNNYVFALLLFAIIIEIILLPFGIKQQKNSIKQAKLRPKEMAIRKKYAGRDDAPTRQKMTQEIQELQQKEGFNPMAGCLPLLIQLPIVIALYNVVMDPLQYICRFSSATIQQISDIVTAVTGKAYNLTRNIDLLSDMQALPYSDFANVEGFTQEIYNSLPNLKILGGAMDLGAVPSIKVFNWLLLVPVLTFVSYFLSMKINRKLTYQPQIDDKAQGCSNAMMDVTMPLMSVWIAFMVPAAIGVYWIFKSIIGIVKQVILKVTMPLPVFTEEDYKAAEKEMNLKPDKAPRNKSGKVVRSLHHIDDEDFADTAEAGRKRREALEAQAAEEAAQKAQKKPSALGMGALKKDDRTEKKENESDTTETKDNDTENNTDGE